MSNDMKPGIIEKHYWSIDEAKEFFLKTLAEKRIKMMEPNHLPDYMVFITGGRSTGKKLFCKTLKEQNENKTTQSNP